VIRDLMMATRVSADGVMEAEPIVVDLRDDGGMCFVLDNGERIEFDFDDLIAIATGEPTVGADRGAA
jgi:hypothetical protein